MITQEILPVVDRDLVTEIYSAHEAFSRLGSPVLPTQLMRDNILSDRYDADIWFASELHQVMKAYKIRGVFNAVRNLSAEQRTHEMVTASAGNQSQAVAYVASRQGLSSRLFMPVNTPTNKVQHAIDFGGESTKVILAGETYDDSEALARQYSNTTGAVFLHAFNSRLTVAGQATLGLDVAERQPDFDAVFSPIGGGGLCAGLATIFKHLRPSTEIIGVEPAGAASMRAALRNGGPTALSEIDTFVDGAAVRQVGRIPFDIAKSLLSQVLSVSNWDLRQATTDLWQRGYSVELAGALSYAGVEQAASTLVGKRVLYILSGGNLSQERYEREVHLTN